MKPQPSHSLATFISLSCVGLLLTMLILAYSAYQWKQAGYFDPLMILLSVAGMAGALAGLLWAQLARRWRKREAGSHRPDQGQPMP